MTVPKSKHVSEKRIFSLVKLFHVGLPLTELMIETEYVIKFVPEKGFQGHSDQTRFRPFMTRQKP